MQMLCTSIALHALGTSALPNLEAKSVFFWRQGAGLASLLKAASHSSDASPAPRSDPFWRLWRSSSPVSKNVSDDLVICFHGSASAVIMKAHFFFIFFIINL